ncbi:hypothetical protein BLNAU_16527 [Blattamonas nauphoetae]|uniref:Uncharacterized protein n=1 Tax=Blattamonas nauphoetae TaxID=2049346 RepID=A0ABQ9X9D0_9EUKA|nr:hypothetical protein BLNAU_16527 [Blattamonas nauphoetae]
MNDADTRNTIFHQIGQYKCNSGEAYTISSCLFREGTAINTDGKAIIVDSGSTANVEKCYFINNQNGGKEGGAIRSDGILTLSGSIFVSNNASKGGALSGDGSKLTLSNCSFFNNEASNEGGALAVWGSFSQSIFCLFSQNTAPSANDVIAWNEGDLQNVISSSLFSRGETNNVKSSSQDYTTSGRVVTNVTSGETIAIDQTAKADQCGSSANRKCQSIRQVLELTSKSTTPLTITIPESTTTLETGLVITDSRTLTITAENDGPSSNHPIIREIIPVGTHLFDVSSATLNLNSLNLEALNTPHFIGAVSSSVIVVSNCLIDGKGTSVDSKHALDIYQSTLTMTDTTVQNVKSTNGGSNNAVFLNEATVEFTRCTFKSLSNPKYGGAIYAKLLATHQLTVKGCTFDGCTCTEGGGGIYVDLRSSTLADKTQQVVVGTSDDNVPTRFTDCTSTNGKGNWILIDMNPKEGNTFSITLENPKEGYVQSNHGDGIGTIAVTPYDPPSSEEVFISDGGNDNSGCSSLLPCSSFARAQTVGMTDGYTLNIRSPTTWTVNNEVTKKVTIKSEDADRATLNLRNVTAANDLSLGGYLRIAAETRLDTIDLVLFQATTSISFVALMTDTTLTISNVEIKTDTLHTIKDVPYQSAFVSPDFNAYAPIWLSGGSLTDESDSEVTMKVIYEGDRGWIGVEGDTTAHTYPNLKLKKWIFGGSPTERKSHGLWLKNVGIVELTECSFSSFKKGWEVIILDGSAIHAELCSSSSLTITSCTFETSSSKGNGGSVSSTLAGGSFTITDSTFSSTASGNGGGLYVVVSGTGVASIADCSFSSCSSSKGGGLYLDISQSTKGDKKDSFSITKGTNGLSFTDCSAPTGSWMYFVMTDRDNDYDRLALQSAFKESPPHGVATGHAASEEFDLFEIVDYSGLYLSDSGSDGNTCQTVSKACQSLATVLSKTLPSEKIVFVIGWGSQNGSTVEITKDFHLKSNTENYSVFHLDGKRTTKDGTDPILQIKSQVEATSIDFRIKQKSWDCAFIHVQSGGSLTFHSAILSHTEHFGGGEHFDSFVHAKGGTVSIEVLDVQNYIDFNGNAPFWLGENSSLIKTSDYQTEIQLYYRSKESFDGGIFGTEASDSEGTTLDLRHITFIGAYNEGSGEDKGAILLNKVKSANIEDCIFQDFVSTVNREETVIKITPNGRNGVVTIKNCQFMNTKRKNSGAIWLTNDQEGAILTIQGSELTPIPFTSCQSEDAGGSVQLAVRGTTLIQFCAFSASKTTTADKSGGAISASVDGGQLTITSCTFESCSSVGNGGAIFIDLSNLGSGTYLLSSLSFGDGSDVAKKNSHGDGKFGRDVFVEIGSRSRDILVAEKFSGSCPSREVTSSDIFTPIERESMYFHDQSMAASILYLFYGYSSGQLIVDSNGEDNALCGSRFLPCSSISVGYEKCVPTQTGTAVSVEMRSQLSINSNLAMKDKIVALSRKGTDILTIGQNGQISGENTLSGTAMLTLSSLTIEFASWTGSETFISLGGGSLVVTGCSFGSSSSPLNGRFCSMSGGSFSIDSTSSLLDSSATRTSEMFAVSGGVATISLMTLPFSVYSDSKGLFMISGSGELIWTVGTITLNEADVKGIVLMSGGSLKMSGGEMSKFKLKSDLISGSGTVDLFDTTFTSMSDTPVTSNSGGFHVVGMEIQSGQTVTIGKEGETTSFSKCSSNAAGGAIGVVVKGLFTVESTSFSECSSHEKGGGLSMIVEGSGIATVSGSSFSKCHSDGNGGGFSLDITGSTLADKKSSYFITKGSSSLSFSECSSDLLGRWFAIHMSSASDYARAKMQFDFSDFAKPKDAMGLVTNSESFDLLLDLVLNDVFLGDFGNDIFSCSVLDYPCLTRDSALSKLTGTEKEQAINIVGVTTWVTNGEFTKPENRDPYLLTIKTASTENAFATINLQKEADQEYHPPNGFVLIETSVTFDKINLKLAQSSSNVAFISTTANGILELKDVNVEVITPPENYQKYDFQSFIFVPDGNVKIEKLSFGENMDFGENSPIWLSGGSLIDESENEVTMRVIYGGDRGWIGVEGNTATSTYPNLKLKKWIFGGNSTAKKSHGLWLKNVGAVELTDCSFSSFKKGSEETIRDGSAIHAELCSLSSLTITSCSFTSCSSLGNGGAIFIDLSNLESGNYKLSSLSFGDGKEGGEMNSHGDGKSGRDVFVEIGSRSRDILVAEKFSGSCPSREESSTDIFTPFERESMYFHDQSMAASILYLFYGYSSGQLIVDSNGEDNALCGYRFLPCSSISVGYEKCVPTQTGTAVSVEMRSPLTIYTKLAMKDKIVALSRKSTEILTIGQNGQISGENTLSGTASLTLSSLTIEFDSWTGSETFISLGGGSLIVAGCSFGLSLSPLNGRFCSMSGGSLLIDSASSLFDSSATRTTEMFAVSGGVATISLMTLPFSVYSVSKGLFKLSGSGELIWNVNTIDLNHAEVKGIVLMSGGSLKMSGGEMSKFKLKSDLISGSGTVELFDTTFTSMSDTPVTSNSEGFHVVGMEIQSGQTVTIGKEGETTSFSKCSSSAAGGAIGVVVKGLFTVESTSFSECSSSGNGGALSMIVEGSGVATVSGSSFANCESKGNGGGFSLDITESTLADKKSSYFITAGSSSLSFTDCTSSGASNWLFISFTSFEDDYLLSKLDFPLTSAIPNKDALGFDQTSYFDLIYPPPTEFFISDNGSSDSKTCRDESNRCTTLGHVLSLMEGTVKHIYIVHTSTWIKESKLETPSNANDFALTIKTASKENAFATIILQKETDLENDPPSGFILIETSVTFDKINLKLAQSSSNVAFISTTANGILILKDVNVEVIKPPENYQKYDFQSFIFVPDGNVKIEKLSFGENMDFGENSPIWLSGGSVVDESENKVTMRVIYGGDRGWIGVEGDTTTHTYPDLKLKKWVFGGNSTAKKSHGLWLKNVGTVELTDCSFSSFKKGSEDLILDGSAIHAELCSSSSLTITSCSFTSCSSQGNGGAIFNDLSSLESGQYLLSSLSFGDGKEGGEMNSHGDGKFGQDLCLSCKTPELYILPDFFDLEDHQLKSAACLVNQDNAIKSMPLYQFVKEPFVFVSTTANSENCSTPAQACQSFRNALLAANVHKTSKVYVIDSVAIKESLQVTKPFVLKGSYEGTSKITLSSSHTFTLQEPSIISNVEFCNCTGKVFSSSSTLTIERCIVKTTSVEPFLSISDKKSTPIALLVSESDLKTGHHEITCEINNPESSITIEKSPFISDEGLSILLTSSSLSALISSFTFTVDTEAPTSSYKGQDSRVYLDNHRIDLTTFFHPKPTVSTALASETGIDSEDCSDSSACYSLYYSSLRLNRQSDSKILIDGSVVLSEVLTHNSQYELAIQASTTTTRNTPASVTVLNPLGSANGILVNNGKMKIENIPFTIKEDFVATSFIISSSNLQFLSSSVTAKGPMPTLFSITRGSLTVEEISFDTMTFGTSQFINFVAGLATAINIVDAQFTKVTSASSLISSTSTTMTTNAPTSVNMSSVSFLNCQGKNGNFEDTVCSWTDSLVSFIGVSATLENVMFTNCHPGCIHIVDSNMSITGGSFSNNHAQLSESEHHQLIQHNIAVQTSTLTIAENVMFNEERADNVQNSLWISYDSTTASKFTVPNPHSLFYSPSVTSMKPYSFSDKLPQNLPSGVTLQRGEFLVHITGKNLFSLCEYAQFQVGQESSSNFGRRPNSQQLMVSHFVAYSEGNEAYVILNSTKLVSEYGANNKAEWKGSVVFGFGANDVHPFTSGSFTIKEKNSNPYSKGSLTTSDSMLIVLAIIAGVLFVTLVVLLIIPRPKGEKPPVNNEMVTVNDDENDDDCPIKEEDEYEDDEENNAAESYEAPQVQESRQDKLMPSTLIRSDPKDSTDEIVDDDDDDGAAQPASSSFGQNDPSGFAQGSTGDANSHFTNTENPVADQSNFFSNEQPPSDDVFSFLQDPGTSQQNGNGFSF